MPLNDITGHDDDDDQNSLGGPGAGRLPGGGVPVSRPPAAGTASNGVLPQALEGVLINLNETFKAAPAVMFRDGLVERTFSVLIGKTKPNPLLVGPAGVGKSAIAEDVARRIAIDDTLVPDQLKNFTVWGLAVSSLVSGTSYRGQLEEKIQAVIEFAADPTNRAILFIDEIHQLSGRDSSYAQIAQILKPAMARGDIRVIGATTTQESRSLDDDPAFRRRFSRLVVDELTPDQTFDVLQTMRGRMSLHYRGQVTVTDDVLRHVVRTADANGHQGSHRPDSAITLLDRAMADRILEHRRNIVTAMAGPGGAASPVVQALQAITDVPLTTARVLDVARRMLTGSVERPPVDRDELDTALKSALRGQDTVIDELVERVARESLDVFPRKVPMAWMFAGASGVGKTETARIIAEHVTGQAPIILNMTEYHSPAAVSRIIGAPAGYVGHDSNSELPFDSLESDPYRVILLDEFEKADPAVQRLFLRVLDEGKLTTSRGREIDFSKAIVIATTNAARESLDGRTTGFTIGDAPKTVSRRSLATALAQHFDAELLGRFSLLLGYSPISESVFREIIATSYARERERIVAERPSFAGSLPAAIPDDEIARICQESFVASQGARPAARAVRTWIEDALLAGPVSTPALSDGADDDDAASLIGEPRGSQG